MKKLITSAFCCLMILACAGKDKPATSPDDVAAGEQIYKKFCILCHGADGKLGINGAKDITVSALTLEERVALINTGKTLMTPFEGILTPDQMKAVASYTMTLK
ncbi:MAG: cytochrome c [Saprospiraceae bacterium]